MKKNNRRISNVHGILKDDDRLNTPIGIKHLKYHQLIALLRGGLTQLFSILVIPRQCYPNQFWLVG